MDLKLRGVIRKIVVAGILSGAMLTAQSEEVQSLKLLCEGNAYLDGSTSNMSFIFTRLSNSKIARIWTPEGFLYGKSDESEQMYFGDYKSGEGKSYYSTLDRYSGQMVILQTAPSGSSGPPSFIGYCRKAKPKY